jgi:putative phage-type endonuclease
MAAKLLMTADEIARHPDEWEDYREASIGSSEVAVLLGIAPRTHGNPFSLYVEKTTGERVNDENDDMERGRVLESYVTAQFANMRPDLMVLPGGLYRDADCPWMSASYDRFAVSRDTAGARLPLFGTSVPDDDTNPALRDELRAMMVPVEAKTAISRHDIDGTLLWGEPYSDQIPVHYKAQAYWQMMIWGSDTVYVPVQFMGSWKTELYVVQRTADAAEDMELMVKEAAAFLDRLTRGDAPDLDWSPESARALRTLTPMQPDTSYRATLRDARRLKSAYLAMKRAERKYGLLQNQLAQKAGGAQHIVVPDPERPGKDVNVLNRSTYEMETIDVGELRAHEPATAARYTRKTPVDKWAPGQRWMKLGR